MSGKVVHFEVPYDDADRARSFYRDVFGWDIQPVPEFDYNFVQTGPVGGDGMPTDRGYIGGGMFSRQEPVGRRESANADSTRPGASGRSRPVAPGT